MRRLYLLALVLTSGCDRGVPPPSETSVARVSDALDGGSHSGAAASASDGAAPAPARVGVLRGRVLLAPGAALPLAAVPLRDGKPPTSHARCPPFDQHDRRSVARSGTSGGLSPVHLAITGMRAVGSRPARHHELFIDGCRLRPTMVGAMRGDRLRITNRSDVPFMPLLPGDTFMRALMRGQSREVELTKLGLSSVACGFGSYCGETVLLTVSHPLYAVTDAEGRFEIEGVPLDDALTLHAFHPLFDLATLPFTLSDEEPERSIEVRLKPQARAARDSPKRKRSKRAPSQE